MNSIPILIPKTQIELRLLALLLLPVSVLFLPVSGAEATGGHLNLVSAYAPKALASVMRKEPPLSVTVNQIALAFAEKKPGLVESKQGDLVARIVYEHDPVMNALWYQVHFENQGQTPIKGLALAPLKLRFSVNPPEVVPRVRYLTGSYHYDACYPPRAFQEVERVFLTHDHAKPVTIGGNKAYDYVPMLQFAVGRDSNLAGFMVGFEWSAGWSLTAGWERANSFTGEPLCDFLVTGTMTLGDFSIPPATTVRAPKVHFVFFEGNGWSNLDNAQKRYIRDRIAYKIQGQPNFSKVTYDHWFGIHSGFNLEEMLRQAKRAAELGCEFFCMDAGWYGKGAFGASGKGVWDEPDPVKFPNGRADVRKLSDSCRSLGMGFGIWHQVETGNGSGVKFDMATAVGREAALAVLRRWCTEYHLTWMRWEMAGTGGLEYMNGYSEVMDRLTKEFPDLNIECCLGGGTRFDLGMIRYATSTWLSDHTANPDVCRFNQTGALRFWPSYFLNLAVRAHRNTGDQEASTHNLISRMVGAASFNGDVAQWSPEATTRIRKMIDLYKSFRKLQAQPVFFPLPQPRSPREWDAVVFGDGTGPGQLLFVFRMEGPDNLFIKAPGGASSWKLLLCSGNARLEPQGDGYLVSLDRNSSALWKR